MSSRPLFRPHKVINSASMAADVISDVSIIQMIAYVSYGIVWSGSPTGTFSIEVSNDYEQNSDGSVRNPGTWTPITLSSAPAASGSAGSGFIDVEGIAAYAIRLKYTRTSGSGTLSATFCGKVI